MCLQRVLEPIKEGKVIADNSNERERLSRQRKSIKLQTGNLFSKKIPIFP